MALPVAGSISILPCSMSVYREPSTAATPFSLLSFPKVNRYIHGRCTEGGQLLHNLPELGIHV